MQIANSSSSYILSADVGGSHITVGICDLNTHTLVENNIYRVDVDSKSAANDILTSWVSVFQRVLGQNVTLAISGLSIAMPGPFDYEKGVSYIRGLNKYEALYGMDIKKYLADLIKTNPQLIRFRNDAESTIDGEVLKGAGKEYNTVIGVTLGTGLGSAYSKNKVTKDLNLGSNHYKESIADNYLSTRWFLKRYHALTGTILSGGVKELAQIAERNQLARNIFIEFADNLSEFLLEPVEQLSPDVLLLCGNIAKASKFFMPYLTSKLSSINIVLAQLDESAPLIGAATMFVHKEK